MAETNIVPGRIKAALIGGGFIGPVHAEALRRIGIEVVGLLGSNRDRAKILAERLAIAKTYENLDDLLGDDVQVVHVASPNRAHYDQTRRILEAGKHVLCEKPLAVKSTETSNLCALSRARPGQVAAINYNVRFYPLCHEMRARVARGEIGHVLSVTGSYTQDWLLYPEDYNWRVEPDGGTNLRAVSDIGTHWMDLAQFVVNKRIISVNADLATFHKQRHKPVGPADTFSAGLAGSGNSSHPVSIETEDHGAVLLRMEGGTHGVFHVSQMVAGRKNRLYLEVAGTHGALSWDSETQERLWIGKRKTPSVELLRDPPLLSPSAAALCEYPGGHAEGFADTFKQLALAVYRAIGKEPGAAPAYPTFEDGHREILLCEAIALSAREGKWVDVADV